MLFNRILKMSTDSPSGKRRNSVGIFLIYLLAVIFDFFFLSVTSFNFRL